MELCLLLAGCYVGWNIGANDSANCIGTMVGAGFISFRRAALLMGVFVIFGGVLQGHHVMKTVGKGIVISSAAQYERVHNVPPPDSFAEHFPEDRLPSNVVLAALLSAGLFVTLATFLRTPVSTSQAMVGAVAGAGLALLGPQGDLFQLHVLVKIFICWILSPILTLAMAILLLHLLRILLRHGKAFVWSRVLQTLLFVTASYVAFSLGANDVGNAMGPLMNLFPERGMALAAMGGIAMAVGAFTFGRRVCDTVGKQITDLDYSRAFCAQLSAAVGVHVFSLLGIPVSTSQAIVGAVIGVGLVGGGSAIHGRKLPSIVLGWIITPLLAGASAFSFFLLLQRLSG